MRGAALVLVLVLAAPAGATVLFNGGAAMTANGSYTGSKIPPGGGIILHASGTFDGASVALEANAGAAWIPADTCEAMTAAQVCRAAPGPVDLRITITGAGGSTSISVVGFEALAVVSSGSGGAAAAWSTITGGTSTEDFLIGATGTMAASPGGVLHASGITQGTDSSDRVITLSKLSGVAFGARPTSSDAHIFFDGPITGADCHIWYDDSIGTWAGLNFAAGTNRWLVGLGSGLFRSESAVGMLGSGSNLTTAVFRAHTSYNVGLGGTPASGIGTLVADGTAALTFASTYVQQLGCKFFGKLASAPGGAAECDSYYDTDNQSPCVHTGAGFVEVGDLTTSCS